MSNLPLTSLMKPACNTRHRISRDSILNTLKITGQLTIPNFNSENTLRSRPGECGSIATVNGVLYIFDCQEGEWVPVGPQLASCGTDAAPGNLVAGEEDNVVTLRQLVAGDNITITRSANDCDIIISAVPQEVTLSSCPIDGIGQSLVVDGTGPDLTIRGIENGRHINVTIDEEDPCSSVVINNLQLTIPANAGIPNSATLVAPNPTDATITTIKDLVGGEGVTITETNTTVTISVNPDDLPVFPVVTDVIVSTHPEVFGGTLITFPYTPPPQALDTIIYATAPGGGGSAGTIITGAGVGGGSGAYIAGMPLHTGDEIVDFIVAGANGGAGGLPPYNPVTDEGAGESGGTATLRIRREVNNPLGLTTDYTLCGGEGGVSANNAAGAGGIAGCNIFGNSEPFGYDGAYGGTQGTSASGDGNPGGSVLGYYPGGMGGFWGGQDNSGNGGGGGAGSIFAPGGRGGTGGNADNTLQASPGGDAGPGAGGGGGGGEPIAPNDTGRGGNGGPAALMVRYKIFVPV